jgi:hypothetical protein
VDHTFVALNLFQSGLQLLGIPRQFLFALYVVIIAKEQFLVKKNPA